jgi:hypothetical protein
MAAAFAKDVRCVVVGKAPDAALARCTRNGVELDSVLRDPKVQADARNWR